MKHCDNCGRELLDEAVVCPSCKNDLRNRIQRQTETKECLNCGNILLEAAVKCPKCGMSVKDAEAELTVCSNCGKAIMMSETVCPYCGHDRSKMLLALSIVLGALSLAVFILLILFFI